MRLRIDQQNDALYLRLDESEIAESEEVQPGVILDYDAQGRVIGIELLDLSKRVSSENLKSLQFETS